ncbi:MAG: hypothetical protein RSE41_08170 [Clostridia bacterium]
MAEYVTQDELSKYGKKSTANAGLTLGIIGTGLAALQGMNSGNGILGGIFGGNSNSCGGPTAWEAWQKECSDNVALTSAIWQTRVTDLQEKFDLYTRLDNKIGELEKTTSIVNAQLPLMFQLANVTSERYTDDKVYADRERQSSINAAMEAQILMRPTGKVALPFSDLITGVPQMPKIIYQTTNCGCGCGSDSSVG